MVNEARRGNNPSEQNNPRGDINRSGENQRGPPSGGVERAENPSRANKDEGTSKKTPPE